MNLLEFSKLVAMLFITEDEYEVTFNFCDKDEKDEDEARTYVINDFLSFGEFMNDWILLPKDEYYVQILEIKIKK